MADGEASKSVQGLGPAKASWRDDARRSLGARFGALADAARERRWLAAAAVAILVLSGAGVVANVGGASTDRAEALEKSVAERETRVAELDTERKRREDQLADLQKRLNAKHSEIAEAEDRASALEKRRAELQHQVAELVAPVAANDAERVSDRQPEAASVSAGTPPDESVDDSPAPSTARIDQAAEPESRGERVRAAARTESDAMAAVASKPFAGQVRVFIHVRSADPVARERAAAVAAELRRRGVTVAEIRGVRLPVRQDSVRFFYDEDRDAVPELQDAVRSASPHAGAPTAKDLRSFGAPPRRGTLELWLS